MKVAILATVTLLTAFGVLYNHQTGQQQAENNLSSAYSRDFVAWMNTVPKDPWGYTGIKALVLNINPTLTPAESDQMAVDLTNAAKKYPEFCNTGDEKKDKMEFAAFLSIIGAETSFSNNFPCTIENGCPNCQACSYNTEGEKCQDDPKLQYYGRGPLQISWNYNYGDFSEYLNRDRNVFLDDPDLVTSTTEICWSSAIWFWNQKHHYGGWCEPQAAWPPYATCQADCEDGPEGCSQPGCTAQHWVKRGKESCHDAIHDGDGFGQVMSIINGGYDCCPTSHYGPMYGHTLYRQWWYIDIYNRWTGEFQYDNLSDIQSTECPLAKKINCGRMANGQCYNSCCQFA